MTPDTYEREDEHAALAEYEQARQEVRAAWTPIIRHYGEAVTGESSCPVEFARLRRALRREAGAKAWLDELAFVRATCARAEVMAHR